MTKKEQESAAADQKKDVKNPVEGCFSGFDFSKLEIKIEDMFKGGVHFGHHKSRKNPRMDEYIFTTKNNINILDLEKTAVKLKEALSFIEKIVAEKKAILFVGTKKQAKNIVEAAAKKCEMPYVTERWLGGTFTNFSVMSKRLKYLRDELVKIKNGEYDKHTKFERMKKAEEVSRMERKMGGIKNMTELPGAIFVSSMADDKLAVKEAVSLNIPVVSLVDTNIDPRGVDYPIPANEDAVSSIKLMSAYIIKAILSGREKAGKQKDPKDVNKKAEKSKEKIKR